MEYGDKRRTSDTEVFSNVYHKLVHSGPALQMMLQVEQSYALAVSHLMGQRNEQIADLTARYVYRDHNLGGVFNDFERKYDVATNIVTKERGSTPVRPYAILGPIRSLTS